MSLTIYDLQDRLRGIDELSLLEILNIDSSEIVEKFLDKIEDNFDKLITEFEDEDESSVDG